MINISDLGLPEKFHSWSPHQCETVEQLLESESRIKVLSAPTGSGKTLIATAYARVLESRYAYVTHMMSLQDQYIKDFSPMVSDLRGRSNYECISAHSPTSTCEGAPCLDGFECFHRFNDCLYDQAELQARQSPWGIITNYAKWLSIVNQYQGSRSYDNRYGKIDLLILDECHKIDDWVTKFTSVDISATETDIYLGIDIPDTLTVSNQFLQAWASEALKFCRKAYQTTVVKDDQRAIENLGKQLSRLATQNVQWIIDRSIQSKIQARPLWPDQFIESYLLMGIPNILIMSATITESRVRKMGIRDYLYHKVPSTFPSERRKFIYLDQDPGVKLTYRSSEPDKQIIYDRLSLVLKNYLDYNCVVYTVSHNRTKETWSKTDLDSRASVIIDNLDMFLSVDKPSVLLSASIVEGVDFRSDLARIGVMIKVPYPSLGDELTKARMKSDSDYYTSLAADQVTQFVGRFMRHADDWGYVICLDEKIIDLLNDTYFEDWFLDAVVYPFPDTLPLPPVE